MSSESGKFYQRTGQVTLRTIFLNSDHKSERYAVAHDGLWHTAGTLR
jgi:hypothetical protein